MIRIASSLVALVFAGTVLGCASAPPPPAAVTSGGACPPDSKDDLCSMTNEQLAHKMLETTGAAALGKRVADAMLDNLKKSGLSAAVVEHFKRNIHPEELTE